MNSHTPLPFTLGPKTQTPTESSQISSLKRQMEVLEERIEILETLLEEQEEKEAELWK